MTLDTENGRAAERFLNACSEVRKSERPREGIGTLSERTLHAVIKKFIEPDERFHEVKLAGGIADIKNADGIFEVQTRAFDRLRGKLERFLEEDAVTVVYPIATEKRLIWIDPATGELSPPRKSPKKGKSFDAAAELYKLGPIITHKRLSILLLFVELDEYRTLRGKDCAEKTGKPWRKRFTRCESIPTGLTGATLLADNSDYAGLLPSGLPGLFTSRELAKAARISLKQAQTTLMVLVRRGVVRCEGKKGRLKLYKALEGTDSPQTEPE